MSNKKNLQAVPDVLDEEVVSPPETVETAFLVIIQSDGSTKCTSDLEVPLTLTREANVSDMRRGCLDLVHEIQANITAGLAAQHVLSTMEQIAQTLPQPGQPAQTSSGIVLPR